MTSAWAVPRCCREAPPPAPLRSGKPPGPGARWSARPWPATAGASRQRGLGEGSSLLGVSSDESLRYASLRYPWTQHAPGQSWPRRSIDSIDHHTRVVEAVAEQQLENLVGAAEVDHWTQAHPVERVGADQRLGNLNVAKGGEPRATGHDVGDQGKGGGAGG